MATVPRGKDEKDPERTRIQRICNPKNIVNKVCPKFVTGVIYKGDETKKIKTAYALTKIPGNDHKTDQKKNTLTSVNGTK